MPRLARTVAVGCAHHITQRGNNRQDVFFVDDDRRVYLELLGEQAEKYGLQIEGYCLMSNHVHLVAVPKAEEALAKAVGRTHFRYTQYINRFHKRNGHLWQGRFYSCALDTRHFWLALKYIERNPVRVRLCRKPWRYEWSSAAAHVDERELKECGTFSRLSGLLGGGRSGRIGYYGQAADYADRRRQRPSCIWNPSRDGKDALENVPQSLCCPLSARTCGGSLVAFGRVRVKHGHHWAGSVSGTQY